MNKIAVIIYSILLLSFGCKINKPAAKISPALEKSPAMEASVKYSDQTTWILGYFNRDRLTSPPHSEWFLKGYDEYQFNSEAVNKLFDISKDNITIKIVMGTWCPDSRREVPRFMRIIDAWQFPADKITFIGVDNEKLSPIGEYDKLNIQRVPTFIFYKNNIELGRIIENPVTSLEQDIVNILTGNEK
jgi:thiol-disulfide isomerase/thioredoxin